MALELKNRLSFPGGVHPAQSKALTQDKPIQPGPTIKEATVLLSQHTGAMCRSLVNKGDTVQAGQKIGDSEAFISAPVHAPIAGKVKEISLHSHAAMGRCPAIVIEAAPDTAPKQPSFKLPAGFDENKYSAEQICDAVRQAGIVGMGGAGFPTRVKIEPNPQTPKHTLIINGCECEPYITCDYRIMLEWADQIIAGARLARRAAGCSQTIIVIEDNKPQAIEAITNALKDQNQTDDIKVVCVKTKYPQGGERQLIKAVLNKQVSTGGIPPMIGLVVLNVATAAAIADAVIYGNPLTHRVVTVTGEAVSNPGNFYVPIGTPIEELVNFCAGLTERAARVIVGGPMMGIAIADIKTPVTKTTGSLTILTHEQIRMAKSEQQTPCIHCGRCLQSCPEHLNPTKIAHAVKAGLYDLAQSYYISACTECGCCSYVCPANIELTGYIKTGKVFLARQKKKMPA